jgi:DNA-binding MarR family transcriptional regulator
MVDHLGEATSNRHMLATMTEVERRVGGALAARMARHALVMRASHARLLHLVPPEGARPSELAQGWISKQAIGKRIQEMVGAGLLTVEPDSHDGRASIVRRTAEGDHMLALILEEVAGLETELAARVGERRYRTFRAVLEELAAG